MSLLSSRYLRRALAHLAGDHAPTVELMSWEVYEVPSRLDSRRRFEAQGTTDPRPGGWRDVEWVHGSSPGAVLNRVIEHWPERQHEVLVSHYHDRHLCPEENPCSTPS